MVKVIFQLSEKFYWIDHVEMFEVSSFMQNNQIIPWDTRRFFLNKYPGTFCLGQQAKTKISDAYQ